MMVASLNLKREYVLAVLAAFVVVAVIGAVALAAFLYLQSDAAIANGLAGVLRTGQLAGGPIAR